MQVPTKVVGVQATNTTTVTRHERKTGFHSQTGYDTRKWPLEVTRVSKGHGNEVVAQWAVAV